jgi:hypothetical protein
MFTSEPPEHDGNDHEWIGAILYYNANAAPANVGIVSHSSAHVPRRDVEGMRKGFPDFRFGDGSLGHVLLCVNDEEKIHRFPFALEFLDR